MFLKVLLITLGLLAYLYIMVLLLSLIWLFPFASIFIRVFLMILFVLMMWGTLKAVDIIFDEVNTCFKEE